MRIAFVVTAFPNRSEAFVVNQVAGLIRRGHEVDIYAHRAGHLDAVHPLVPQYGLLDRTYCPHVPTARPLRLAKLAGLIARGLICAPLPVLRSLNVFRHGAQASSGALFYGLVPLLGGRTYDIIHCAFGPNGLKGAFYRENGLLRGRLLTAFYGFDVTTYPREHGAGVYRTLFAKGDYYIGVTNFITRQALRWGCPEDRIATLPVGVDLARFAFAERRLAPGEEVHILTVARLVEVKGVEYGIRAVAKIISRYPSVRYQIIGDGPLRASLDALTRQLGVNDRVNFTGAVSQETLMRAYARAHLFMLPSVVATNGAEEGFGTVLAEAQAMGLPVLGTRIGGLPETVPDGQSGFLVPQRDVDALAERLAYLIEHPEVWPAMGRAGRAHVERNYDYEKLNDRLVEIYEGLLRDT